VTPAQYLFLAVCILVALAIVEARRVRRRRRMLRELAKQWRMHFARGDRLRLAARIADKLPIPGAANVRVRNLLYCTDGNRHKYLFTIEYHVGVVRGKLGRWRVGGFQEPVSRGPCPSEECGALYLAPQGLSLEKSYGQVHDALAQMPPGG
jgi:heme exporter protein D